MSALEYFDSEKRKRVRQKKEVGFWIDYFFHSEVADYRKLRLLINGLVGLLLCASLYYLGWKRINFGDFDYSYGIGVKWFVIILTTITFTWSSNFRCALIIVLIGALGKNGQAPLTLLIMNNLSDGPIENIIDNYKLTADIVICHLQLQAKIISNRVAMFTGPIEKLLERQLNKGLRLLKKATRYVRQLIAPFLSEIRPEKTSEDVVMDKSEQQLKILAQRKALGAGDTPEEDEMTDSEMANMTQIRPGWTRFKTKEGLKIAERMTERCNDIFSKGVDKCREIFASVQRKCYDTLPVIINWFVCKPFSMEGSCQDVDRRRNQLSACKKTKGSPILSQSMEQDLKDVSNMTHEMDEELKVSLHMVAIESPRVEMEYSLQDLLLMIKAGVTYVKSILKSVKQVIMALLIYAIYKLFSQAVVMIEKYNTNVDFNNCFIGKSFWLIDQFRQKAGQEALLRLEKSEWKKWKLRKVFSKPTKLELCAARRPFFIWMMLAFFTVTLILVDWYIYVFLDQLVSSSEKSIKMEVRNSAQVVVLGKGIVADFINDIIKVNQTTEQDEQLTNAHCLSHPRRPDIEHYVYWIILPLIFSFLIQVLFSYFIKRVVVNFFLPFMFPKRDRARLVYLYNKIQFLRHKDRQESRARMRFLAQRWSIQRDEEKDSPSWFKLKVLDRLFKTGQCLLCQNYRRPATLKFCSKCPATFCKHCLEEMHGQCYACQAEAGQVTSARTQYLAPTTTTSTETRDESFVTNMQKANQVEKQKYR